MDTFRREIRSQILSMIGGAGAENIASRTPDDHGYFGPRSSAWRVHGDVAAMMIGGVGALLLQMLHPAALAGVWDHSDFRTDMPGRLRRTAQFVSGTTYGSTARADALIAHVRAIHDRIDGVLPDGTAYSANDPGLLTWVHVAEVRSFLASYLRSCEPLFPAWEQNRYYAETAIVARKLGASDVPATRKEVEDYLEAMRPALRADERTRVAAKAVLTQPAPSRALAPAYRLMLEAGIDLLPLWAARMHGLGRLPLGRPAVAIGAMGVGTLLRWAMRASAQA